jgi:ribosomal protein S18 acetylase RimI-like enzyme
MATVRRPSMDDLGQLVELVHGYRAFYKQDSTDGVEEFVRTRLTTGDSVFFVAEVDGELVGFTQCYPGLSTVSLSTVWLLNDLFVLPDFRKHGIADALMDEAEHAAREAGATRIWLRTAHTNEPAQALYEKRGWVYDETFKRYDLIF